MLFLSLSRNGKPNKPTVCVTVVLYTRNQGLVLEFEMWRLISFIDDHFGPPWRLLEAKHHTATAHFGTLTQCSVEPSVPVLLTAKPLENFQKPNFW